MGGLEVERAIIELVPFSLPWILKHIILWLHWKRCMWVYVTSTDTCWFHFTSKRFPRRQPDTSGIAYHPFSLSLAIQFLWCCAMLGLFVPPYALNEKRALPQPEYKATRLSSSFCIPNLCCKMQLLHKLVRFRNLLCLFPPSPHVLICHVCAIQPHKCTSKLE